MTPEELQALPAVVDVTTAGQVLGVGRGTAYELVRTGRLRVPVDRVLPLEEIVEAHRYAESPQLRGKVVVTVA